MRGFLIHGIFLADLAVYAILCTTYFQPRPSRYRDRAMYLSVINQRKFLNSKNWKSPYQGFGQSVLLRMISSGLYFPLEEICIPIASRRLPDHPRIAQFLSGCGAGAINAIFMNPGTAAKFALWNSLPGSRYREVVLNMWRNGRFLPFFKGISSTLARDVVFGGVFALLRYKLPMLIGYSHESNAEVHSAFFTDLIAASVATTLSSPFNYIRNIKYGLPASARPISDYSILHHLWVKANTMRRRCGFVPACSLIQQRFRLGWGTLRSGIGMAVGAKLYSTLQNISKGSLG